MSPISKPSPQRSTANPAGEKQDNYDVAIIGCGVSGANIARCLSAYKLKIAVLEAAADTAFGTSKANSGIIHAGFHHNPKYLKARLEIQGNLMFERLRKELDFPFKRCGVLVAALHYEEMKVVEQLYTQGLENGVIGLELCSRERLLDLEPKLSQDVVGGLHAPGGGIVEPYRFVFALVESALRNGVKLFTQWQVKSGTWNKADGLWRVESADGRSIHTRYVINAAGLYADVLSRAFGAEEFSIIPRKGEYYLLDRLTKGRPNKVVFPVPSAVSKGILVIPTVEGTVLVGPTSNTVPDKTDTSTDEETLEHIMDVGRKMLPSISRNDVISSFAGLRPTLGEDFYIEASKKVPSFIQVAGIQSPGLTASPAIGEFVKDLLKGIGLELTERSDWNPAVERRTRIRELSPYELDAATKRDPAYGRIVCRCENISEAELIQAIRAGHDTLDGIKYYTRAQMGRCQGGFCTYKIIKLIMRETGKSWEQITKHGEGSRVLEGEL